MPSYAPIPINDAGQAGRVTLVAAKSPVDIAIPALHFGATCLERMPHRESTHGLSWRDVSYHSFAPATLLLEDATLHSDAGIVLLGNHVVRQSLDHTAPERHHYKWQNDRFMPQVTEPIRLEGRWASLLCGSNTNHFHALVDCVGRLAALPDGFPREIAGLLVPAGCTVAPPLLQILAPDVPQRAVAAQQTIRLDALYLPSSMQGHLAYHPSLAALFDRLPAFPSTDVEQLPKRFYIDRRQSRVRPLSNETELIDALRPFGIVPVRLESLPLPAQIRLFADAELIVAPHGAGLANLLFAGPASTVLELLMDTHLHWAYRRLAALRRIVYDCIVGRADPAPPETLPVLRRWQISVPHVVAAVHHLTG